MDAAATTALIAFGLILGSFFTARILAAVRLNRPKLPSLSVYGDFPWIPEGAKAATRKTGGRGLHRAAASTRKNDIAHRSGAVTR
jgi:hypothetical protein